MIHYVDALGGGHFKNVPELLYKLVTEGPGAVKWLNDLGVMFDKEADGTMLTTHGGGTSRKRMHAAKDYSGAEIMRVLRDEVINRGIPVVDFTAAIELILDENGKAAGAVLMNMETREILVARAKTVIIATAAPAGCITRAFRPRTITALRQTVLFWRTAREPRFYMPIRCSIIRQASRSRRRFSARL